MNTLHQVRMLTIALLLVAVPAIAQPPVEKIYGSQLMTEQERVEFREKMQAAKTPQERDQIRWEHHQMIQEGFYPVFTDGLKTAETF